MRRFPSASALIGATKPDIPLIGVRSHAAARRLGVRDRAKAETPARLAAAPRYPNCLLPGAF